MAELKKEFPVGSLLSARQFLVPKLHKDKFYFISNFVGHYSLYEMEKDGSVPIPVIPETIPLQNPHLMRLGASYEIFPSIDTVLIMIDDNGNELYQPCVTSLSSGGIPKPLFGDKYADMQVNLQEVDHENNFAFFLIDDRKNPGFELILANIETSEIISLGKTPTGLYVLGFSKEYDKILVLDNYGLGDSVISLIENRKEKSILLGLPPDQRPENYEKISLNSAFFIQEESAFIGHSEMIADTYSVLFFSLSSPQDYEELPIKGLLHSGLGELEKIAQLSPNIFQLNYNIDGVSYIYLTELIIDDEEKFLKVIRNLVGDVPLDNGVCLGIGYDVLAYKESKKKIPGEFFLSLTKALMPSQLFLLSTEKIVNTVTRITKERVLGIPEDYLSEGESANFVSFDGLKISARLYRPAKVLGYEGSRPLVVYIHGGPTTQERPDFTWFSIPIIQYLTLHGFAVFVPNVRGSTGYGHSYMSHVFKDWGGKDMLDHLEGIKNLEKDPLIDSSKRFVMGRSYGGFMTLSLLSRHPEYWTGGVDMFGPYDLSGFFSRLPGTWQEGFKRMLGDPSKEEDQQLLSERSPKTYFSQIITPLLVFQGRNDPRILPEESIELVDILKKDGKDAEIIIYEDEGHDFTKLKNKIDCFEKVTQFFLEKSK